VRSPNAEILAERLMGARAAIERARQSGHFDYDADLAGLRARDRYTIEITLVEPDYTLLPYLTGDALSAVAREIVEAYGDSSGRVMEHPVGTGPYRLAEWRRGQKVVLAANPDYREEYFPAPPPGADAASLALAKSMAGKRLPQIGRIELSIIEPPQPQLLAFASGALDILDLPFELAPRVIDASGRLLTPYATQGIDVQRVTDLYIGYLYFNMDDAVVGGDAPERLALRRAVLMAYDVAQEIQIVRNGQGRPATQPIPPDVDGHVPGLDIRPPYDPPAARALLDKFSYRDRDGDGWREQPDGRPLALRIGTTPEDRERDDLFRKNMQGIGVRVEFVNRKWADLLKMAREGQLQVWMVGNFATTADAMMLALYGPNAGQNNLARFRNAEFDELYRQSKRTRTDGERARVYERMSRIVGMRNPWGLRIYAIRTSLARPWVHGYRRNPHFLQVWRFLDIDAAAQKSFAPR
jgi:ABC-type transport system substrate-binding protein